MRIKIGKWSLSVDWNTNAELDHRCMNQFMEGTYSCKYCYPPCKKCGRDTSDWDVFCNYKECRLEEEKKNRV